MHHGSSTEERADPLIDPGTSCFPTRRGRCTTTTVDGVFGWRRLELRHSNPELVQRLNMPARVGLRLLRRDPGREFGTAGSAV